MRFLSTACASCSAAELAQTQRARRVPTKRNRAAGCNAPRVYIRSERCHDPSLLLARLSLFPGEVKALVDSFPSLVPGERGRGGGGKAVLEFSSPPPPSPETVL